MVPEREIFDCLKTNARLAAEHCEDLAKLPKRGPTYLKLREELKLIEGCCRQIAWYRGDTRWLTMGLAVEEAHKRAGHWLRKFSPRPLFVKLADNLRGILIAAEQLETRATGKMGLILPEPVKEVRTEGRAVQVKIAEAPHPGVILPVQM